MNSTVMESTRRPACKPATDTGEPGVSQPDAQRWISEFAYYLWRADGCPVGQAEWYWCQAEAAYRYQATGRAGKLERVRDARRFKRLIPRMAAGQAPSPEQVALAALRAWYDVEEAFERLAQLRELLQRMIGEHLVDDGFQVLKAWKHDLNGQEKTRKLAEALRVDEDCLKEADDPEPKPRIGENIVDKEVQEAACVFRDELPMLLKTHPRQWVAYCGKERIGFGPSKVELTQECIRRGFLYDKLLVRMVQPDIPTTRIRW